MKRFYFLLCSLLAEGVFPVYAKAADIWFAPNLKSVIKMSGKDLVSNLNDVAVFKYYCDTVLKMDPILLKGQLSELERRRIKIALECAPLSAPGYQLESFGENLKALKAVDRVASLGGEVSYIALDEPVYYAHYSNTGKRFVGWSIDSICKNASSNIGPVYSKYPGIRIGLIEPVNKVTKYDVFEFMDCFYKYTGQKIDFFHADVVWNRPDALNAAKMWSQVMSEASIKYGVIFNSSIREADNDGWINSAGSNIRKYFKGGGQLDEAIIQSWNREPQQIYPGSKLRSISELPKEVCNHVKCDR